MSSPHLFLVALILVTLCATFSHGLSCYHCSAFKRDGVDVRSGTGGGNGTELDPMEQAFQSGAGGRLVKCAGESYTWPQEEDNFESCSVMRLTYTSGTSSIEAVQRLGLPTKEPARCEDSTSEGKKMADAVGGTDAKAETCYCSENNCNEKFEDAKEKNKATTTTTTEGNKGGENKPGPDEHDAAGLEGGRLGWITGWVPRDTQGHPGWLGGVVIGVVNFGLQIGDWAFGIGHLQQFEGLFFFWDVNKTTLKF